MITIKSNNGGSDDDIKPWFNILANLYEGYCYILTRLFTLTLEAENYAANFEFIILKILLYLLI